MLGEEFQHAVVQITSADLLDGKAISSATF